MGRRAIALLVLALALSFGTARAQTFNARRMGMGGVVLSGVGSTGANVAYRAAPTPVSSARTLPLPLGLIPVLANPPELDPNNPNFNIYEIANLIYTMPWNLQLVKPEPPSNDIVISVAQDSLAVDLGDVKHIFPETSTKLGAVVNGPSLGLGVRNLFFGLVPVVQYDNDLSLNAALHDALAKGVPFQRQTTYQMFDKARAQAAAAAEVGMAMPVMVAGDPRTTGHGLYAGARVKILRGIAYGDADNTVGFTTGDTLFANPVNIQYNGHIRRAGPSDGGWGEGLDLGAVWVGNGLEVGVGVNDIGTQINWKVRESLVTSDPSTGGYSETVLQDGASFTSHVPVVTTVNGAIQLGPVLVAGDVVSGVNNTQPHLGAEIWTHNIAWRAGGYLDSEKDIQGGCGVGLRFGKLGVDLGLSSHGRNITHDRALEMGAGLTFYR